MEDSTIDILLKVAAIVVPVGAIFVAVGLERFKARVTVLNKTVEINSIGRSLSDPNYGDIKVSYQGNEIEGDLVFITVVLHNDSWSSIPEISIKFATPSFADIILSRAHLLFDNGTTYELSLSDSYSTLLNATVAQNKLEEKPANFEGNFDYLTHHREYTTPYINKGQKLSYEMLVSTTNIISDVVTIPLKENILVVEVKDEETVKRQRMNYIHIIALVIYLVSAGWLYTLDTSSKQNILLMIFNSITCYVFAWALWFIGKYLKAIFIK